MLPRGEVLSGCFASFHEVGEVPRGEHSEQRHLVGSRHRLTRSPFFVVGGEVRRDLFGCDGPPPSTRRKLLQLPSDHLTRRVGRRLQATSAAPLVRTLKGTFPFDPVDQHKRKECLACLVEEFGPGGIEQPGFAGVREDVAVATENVAVMASLVAGDNVGDDHVEVEVGGHLQEHLKLEHLRGVFGGEDIEFD